MLKSVAVIATAVLSALVAGQGVTAVAGAARANAAVDAPMTVVAPVTLPESDSPPPGAAQISKAKDGHYWAEAQVDGRWVHFLVDTGASTVALTGQDAQRLGFDLSALTYDRPVMTANGKAMAAGVTLDRVAVAGARVDRVEAMVVREGLGASLLGMSYLGRLSRFEATPTALILRP